MSEYQEQTFEMDADAQGVFGDSEMHFDERARVMFNDVFGDGEQDLRLPGAEAEVPQAEAAAAEPQDGGANEGEAEAVAAVDEDGENHVSMTTPTMACGLLYPERFPRVDDGTMEWSTDPGLAQAWAERLLESTKLASRAVQEFTVVNGADDKPVLVPSAAMRMHRLEIVSQYKLARQALLVQGPPPKNAVFVPATRHTVQPISHFPREQILIPYTTRLNALDNKVFSSDLKLAKCGGGVWKPIERDWVHGALARLAGVVALGSGPLLQQSAFVAFPGTCDSESVPTPLASLDLQPLKFADLKLLKNVAVIYTEATAPSDFDGVSDKSAHYVRGAAAKASADALLVPHLAVVHRVHGQVRELISALQAEIDGMAAAAARGDLAYKAAVAGAVYRQRQLADFDDDVMLDFYAYQLVDETSAIDLYVDRLSRPSSGANKEPTQELLLTNIRTLISMHNTIEMTIDYLVDTPETVDLQNSASIAVPMVPHQVYLQLCARFREMAGADAAVSTPKRARSGARVPIGAERTETAVLEKLKPAAEQTPTKSQSVHRVQFMGADGVVTPAGKPEATATAQPPTKQPQPPAAAAAPATKQQPPPPAATPATKQQPPPAAAPATKQPPPPAVTAKTVGATQPTSGALPAKAVAQAEPVANAPNASSILATLTAKAPVADKAPLKRPASEMVAAAVKPAATGKPAAAASAVAKPVAVAKPAVAAAAAKPVVAAAVAVAAAAEPVDDDDVDVASPQAKKKCTTDPQPAPPAQAAPTRALPAVVQRTPEQQACLEHLYKLLEKYKSQPTEARYGIWPTATTTDSSEYAGISISDPATNIRDALLDAAALINYLGLEDFILERRRTESTAATPKPRSNARFDPV